MISGVLDTSLNDMSATVSLAHALCAFQNVSQVIAQFYAICLYNLHRQLLWLLQSSKSKYKKKIFKFTEVSEWGKVRWKLENVGLELAQGWSVNS